MKLEVVDKKDIEQEFEVMRNAMRNACHVEGLPYMECLPSLKGYALMQQSWGEFTKAYFAEIRKACEFGVATYVMI